jgi:hypothetical protein
MPTQRQTTVWIDVQGKTIAHLLTTATGGSAVQAEIAAISNAAVYQAWEGDLVVPATPSPVSAPLQSVRDQATLAFQTGAGSLVRVQVPAPDIGIFQADGETVDPATIAALIAAVIADVVTADGTALTAYVAGFRSSRK